MTDFQSSWRGKPGTVILTSVLVSLVVGLVVGWALAANRSGNDMTAVCAMSTGLADYTLGDEIDLDGPVSWRLTAVASAAVAAGRSGHADANVGLAGDELWDLLRSPPPGTEAGREPLDTIRRACG